MLGGLHLQAQGLPVAVCGWARAHWALQGRMEPQEKEEEDEKEEEEAAERNSKNYQLQRRGPPAFPSGCPGKSNYSSRSTGSHIPLNSH